MKFFISGQIDDVATIKEIINKVVDAGHNITHDWTATDTFLGGAQDKLNNPVESGRRAQADIQGVIDCDVYVLSSDNKKVGKGMYVELGAALALCEATGKPDVFITGAMHHLSVFYLHPKVVQAATIDDVLNKYKVN
ncbi:MAG TPA: hypothetical protein VLF43_01700 [Candidatus Saccharimonadales bacterium]|nr:hypothetical protein [Candidatus Saccharimonadales bacterium]